MTGRTVPIEEQIAEVDREIALRRALLARRVASGAMPQRYADQRIAVMEAVRETLRRRDNEIGKHDRRADSQSSDNARATAP